MVPRQIRVTSDVISVMTFHARLRTSVAYDDVGETDDDGERFRAVTVLWYIPTVV